MSQDAGRQAEPVKAQRRGAPADYASRPLGARQITVLGMHRSGTSALAGALVAAGAWAGEATDLMPATPLNAKGYFERWSTAATLDAVLSQLGGTWSEPPVDALNRYALEPHRQALVDLFTGLSDGRPEGSVPLVKDPRLSLLAGELPSILGTTDGVVVCVRHPLAVARSLRRSEGLALSTGLALWELYNVMICRGLAGRPVRVWAFGKEQADREALTSIVAGLLADVSEQGSQSDQREASSAHLAPGLLHELPDAQDELEWLTAAQINLWQALAEAARSPQPTALERVELSASARLELSRAAAAAHHQAQVRDALAAADDQRQQLVAQQELAAAEQALAAAAAEAMQAQQADLQRALDESLRTSDELAEALRQSEQSIERSRDEFAAARAQTEGLMEQLREELALSSEQERALSAQLADHARLVDEVLEAYGRSVRVTEVDLRPDVLEWLGSLPVPEVEAGPGMEAVQRLEKDLHLAFVSVDQLKGIAEQAQELWLNAGSGRHPLELNGLADWLAGVVPASGVEVSFEDQAPPRPDLQVELDALRQHRDEVLRDHLAVMSSQSWRVGHALTWPARKAKRVTSAQVRGTGTSS